ncbi:MAG TPA: zinc-dependent metalloprotease [Aeromicrobium sp.]|nr:zinc-dependent metalloprotease [Aeromicrobium sp.]
MIDWKVALATAARLSRPGPNLGADEVAAVVAELRDAAARSEAPVREYAGLHATNALGAPSPVRIVDRPRWVEANLGTFQLLTDPLARKLTEAGRAPRGLTKGIGEKVSGAQVGAILSFVSSKVLGQFDPFWTGPAGEGGRLLLVAPNIVAAERQLDVDPHDFRLWVCLHEETHRVQFTAVPWLREHLRSTIDELVEATDVDEQSVGAVVEQLLGQVKKAVRGDGDASLADVFQNSRQRELVDQLTGVMSLLEGHADVVMDGVGPQVVPSVAQIRRKFQKRRQGTGSLDKIVRRLLGLDAKARQYRDGAQFVRRTVDRVGIEGFNQVWAHPRYLPTKAEILDPDSWVTRVHA